jgi:hypothetical protein
VIRAARAAESWNIGGEVCYDRGTMRGLHDIPGRELPDWEPEPLHLPVSERGEEDPRLRRIQSGEASDEDLPGSHVIVIDLA